MPTYECKIIATQIVWVEDPNNECLAKDHTYDLSAIKKAAKSKLEKKLGESHFTRITLLDNAYIDIKILEDE